MRVGWLRGSPRERASSATGVGCALRPRPLRVSGREMTRPTSWREDTRPRRTVAAKSGVPAKATFKALLWGLALCEEALAHLAHSGLTGLAVGAVQDQDAVQMVYLVLQDPGEQIRGFHTDRGARDVPTGDRDRRRSLDLDLYPRYREASLELFLGGVGGLLDDRVDDNVLLVLQGCHQDALEPADLVGGETHPLVLAHGGQHLLGQVRERAVEAFDRRGAGLEHGVSECPDVECHVLLYLLGIHLNARPQAAGLCRQAGGQGCGAGYYRPLPGAEQHPPTRRSPGTREEDRGGHLHPGFQGRSQA